MRRSLKLLSVASLLAATLPGWGAEDRVIRKMEGIVADSQARMRVAEEARAVIHPRLQKVATAERFAWLAGLGTMCLSGEALARAVIHNRVAVSESVVNFILAVATPASQGSRGVDDALLAMLAIVGPRIKYCVDPLGLRGMGLSGWFPVIKEQRYHGVNPNEALMIRKQLDMASQGPAATATILRAAGIAETARWGDLLVFAQQESELDRDYQQRIERFPREHLGAVLLGRGPWAYANLVMQYLAAKDALLTLEIAYHKDMVDFYRGKLAAYRAAAKREMPWLEL